MIEVSIEALFSQREKCLVAITSISGLVAEYIVAIDVTRVRFPADALFLFKHNDWTVSHLDNGPTRA